MLNFDFFPSVLHPEQSLEQISGRASSLLLLNLACLAWLASDLSFFGAPAAINQEPPEPRENHLASSSNQKTTTTTAATTTTTTTCPDFSWSFSCMDFIAMFFSLTFSVKRTPLLGRFFQSSGGGAPPSDKPGVAPKKYDGSDINPEEPLVIFCLYSFLYPMIFLFLFFCLLLPYSGCMMVQT